MLVLGEVRTSLLPVSVALPPEAGERLLALTSGAQVLRSERPVPCVTSPERLTGVDCLIATGSGPGARVAGTVSARAVLVGGQVLQSSARTVLVRGASGRRMPWSHYLERPGTVEVLGRFRERDTAEAFLATAPVASLLNLGAIAGHTEDRVRASSMIDFQAPFRSRPTVLRWTAELTDEDTGPDRVTFIVEGAERRSLRLRTHAEALPDVVALAEDLALHDWLLTTLTGLLGRAAPGTVPLDQLRPVFALPHLWMPGARLATGVRRFWTALEEQAGSGQQWTVAVQRIRDELALSTLRELGRVTS
jgi:hypothetical protein